MCKGAEVVVVGGGNSAGQGAVYLAKHAQSVHILVRRDGLAETMSKYLIRRIDETPNIHLHPRSEITRLIGDGSRLQAVEYRDRDRGETIRLDSPWVFLFLGASPCTSWLRDTLALDDKGFIKTGPALSTDELARPEWSPSAVREQPAPRLCRRRRPQRFGQARRLGRRRGIDRRSIHPPGLERGITDFGGQQP